MCLKQKQPGCWVDFPSAEVKLLFGSKIKKKLFHPNSRKNNMDRKLSMLWDSLKIEKRFNANTCTCTHAVTS